MLFSPYYAKNYAGIIDTGLPLIPHNLALQKNLMTIHLQDKPFSKICMLNNMHRITGNFHNMKFSWFSRMIDQQRKFSLSLVLLLGFLL